MHKKIDALCLWLNDATTTREDKQEIEEQI